MADMSHMLENMHLLLDPNHRERVLSVDNL